MHTGVSSLPKAIAQERLAMALHWIYPGPNISTNLNTPVSLDKSILN